MADLIELTLWIVAIGIVLAVIVYATARFTERRNPPIGRFMDVGGVRLHYLDRGQGDPIVFIHGNVSMIDDVVTSGLFDKLSTRHRVIAIDRPGFGYSDRPRDAPWPASRQAELIAQALDRLQVPRATVVGHSWGTIVAVALAQQRPDRVRSLVLLSGFYYPEFRFDVMLAAPPATPVLGDILRYTLSPLTGLLLLPLTLRAMFGPPPIPPRFKREFPLLMLLRPWQIRASAEDGVTMIPSAWALLPGYDAMRMPVLIMAGSDDRIVDPEKQSARLKSELEASELEIVRGAGHMIHHTAPDQIEQAIERAARHERSPRAATR